MNSTFPVEHCIVMDSIELVRCDDDRIFIVDRERKELRNLLDPRDVLPLVQRQMGRLPNGELEVLERYQTDEERGAAVIVDSSPTRLDELPRLKL